LQGLTAHHHLGCSKSLLPESFGGCRRKTQQGGMMKKEKETLSWTLLGELLVCSAEAKSPTRIWVLWQVTMRGKLHKSLPSSFSQGRKGNQKGNGLSLSALTLSLVSHVPPSTMVNLASPCTAALVPVWSRCQQSTACHKNSKFQIVAWLPRCNCWACACQQQHTWHPQGQCRPEPFWCADHTSSISSLQEALRVLQCQGCGVTQVEGQWEFCEPTAAHAPTHISPQQASQLPLVV